MRRCRRTLFKEEKKKEMEEKGKEEEEEVDMNCSVC